ncbi:unnamed protein product [Spodoptera littoralis]|uniref:N-acetylneuraminate lyase n=1 Tax=Spodoptera littoralis TaxID=7109 RepID=A0A9P0HYK5_SPOLI|nr:unnamed protein product [Spodoptera littoralis]CAH1637867.1 unnamed protein product [Spodoptera littoralis]
MGISLAFWLIVSCVLFWPTSEAVEPCFEVGGLIAPVFTPVYEDGSLRVDIVPQYAQYLKDNGVDGVLVAATTGEGPNLNVSENKLLLDAWMEAAPPLDLKVISSIGAVPFSDTLEMAVYSEKIGVDAIMALPEVFYKPRAVDDLVYYMELIAEAAPETPLLYDDYPRYTGVYVNMVDFVRAATERITTFQGVKSDVFDNVLLLRNKLIKDQKLYAGDSFYLAPDALLGYDNYVMVELNIFPKEIRDIIADGDAIDRPRTLSRYERLRGLSDIILMEGNTIAAYKEAMKLVTGIDVGPVRPPQRALTEEQKYRLESRLRAYDIDIVYSTIED